MESDQLLGQHRQTAVCSRLSPVSINGPAPWSSGHSVCSAWSLWNVAHCDWCELSFHSALSPCAIHPIGPKVLLLLGPSLYQSVDMPQVPLCCVEWRVPLFWLSLLSSGFRCNLKVWHAAPPSRAPFFHPYTPLHGGMVTTFTISSFHPGICLSTHPLLLSWDLKEFHDQQIKKSSQSAKFSKLDNWVESELRVF